MTQKINPVRNLREVFISSRKLPKRVTRAAERRGIISNGINRIPGIIDLRRFFKGARRESDFFRLMRLSNACGYARFVFITPRSLDKRSTVRNRLRRRAREWVRKNISISESVDIALICKKEAVVASRKKFYEELAKIFVQAGY